MTTPRGLGTIRQTAYVVDDIEKTAAEWAAVHGVGPFFLYDVDTPSIYRGRETPMRGRMGLAQSGIQQVELIQPDLSVPSLYTELLYATGPGFHHGACGYSTMRAGAGAQPSSSRSKHAAR